MRKREALEKVADVCRLKHRAFSTEDCYLHWIGKYFDWMQAANRQGSLADGNRERMEAFLTGMAKEDYSASTQNQAFNAILFFYRHVIGECPENVNALRAKKGQRIRRAPSRDDVRRVLEATEDSTQYPFRLILAMLYGCGLRPSEPLNLRLRDLELSEGRMIVREAKGNKDRLVPIPRSLVDPLNWQIAAARRIWQRAQSQGVPVKLPNRLGRKYGDAGFSQGWFWLFPAANSCIDRRTQARVWWHCLPATVGKAMKKAVRKAGLDVSITPHELRHAWATHAERDGASLRDIQEILGHKSLETTMIYAHPEIERVPSPLDRIDIAV